MIFGYAIGLHPARKDVLCKDGYMHIQFRFALQPGTINFSDETGFETPDPDFWATNGYVVINIDKRGFGLSPKGAAPQKFFDQDEIENLYNAVEWTAYYSTEVNALMLKFFDRNTEIIGPMKLIIYVELEGCDDANIFAGIQKFHGGREVNFNGTYGFPNDIVTKTAQRILLRTVNEELSTPFSPEHDFDTLKPLLEGEIAKVESIICYLNNL